ncbi:MAG: helix-turn-helix domain-containing protein [Candidatus Diapherotrites archaeon]
MKLTSKKTYKVIYFLLGNRGFTQLQASRELGVSFGLVNRVVQWLVSKRFVEKQKNGYYLTDPSGLAALFAFNRDMNSLLAEKILLALPKAGALERIPKNCVLCLDSALENYSGYYRSNRVCVYAEGNKELKEIGKAFQGEPKGNTELWVFKPDLEPETVKLKGRLVVSKLRTLIDLVCDNKTFYAKDLFKELWGVELLES